MKTEKDKLLDDALESYLEKFGVPYPLMITAQKSADEIIKEIEAAIKTGVAVAEEDMLDGADY